MSTSRFTGTHNCPDDNEYTVNSAFGLKSLDPCRGDTKKMMMMHHQHTYLVINGRLAFTLIFELRCIGQLALIEVSPLI
jgi:hypothetical protein